MPYADPAVEKVKKAEYFQRCMARPGAKERKRAYDKALRATPAHKIYAEKKSRKTHLKKFFGMTPEQYDTMLLLQDSVCLLCNRPETLKGRGGKTRLLAVDHDHETGAVRGLLCGHCNTAIGFLLDDPELLRKAADYIEQSKHSLAN